MKYKKTLPYKLKLTAAIGLPLLLGACQEKQEPQHDVEIEFDGTNVDKKLDMKVLQELVNDKTVRYVYMTATGTGQWDGCIARNVSEMRKNFFQPRIDMSPKMRGRGDFDFKLGEASKVPDDSLWYVKQGWTINKKYQNQK